MTTTAMESRVLLGIFLKVADMRYEVGQTVTDVIPLNLPEVTQPPKTNHKRWISSFAAMAACLCKRSRGSQKSKTTSNYKENIKP